MATASEELRSAFLELIDQYVETLSDADDAIDALQDRIDSLRRWKEKHMT